MYEGKSRGELNLEKNHIQPYYMQRYGHEL